MKESLAIVTGASQGIGRAKAVRLAREFSKLVLVARSASNLGETAAEVGKAGADALVLDLDLNQGTAPDLIVSRTLERFGRVDALLNIAGAVPQIDILEMTDEQWQHGMELKLHGARRLTIKAWDALKKTRGSVIFMSGNSAVSPKAGYAAVGTINAAIVALAKAFADKGVTDGVQVNSVLPGPVMTGRRESYLEKWAPAHGMTVEEALQEISTRSGNRALWKAGRNSGTHGVPGVARCSVDDWQFGSNGRQ